MIRGKWESYSGGLHLHKIHPSVLALAQRRFIIRETMRIYTITLALLAFCLTSLSCLAQDEATPSQSAAVAVEEDGAAQADEHDGLDEKIDVYVIPITEAIGKPNLFILRRGLKEAIENDVDMVLLEMDTPGGRVDVTIEMMEMLARFEGITATYVNDEAISAGSFITAATQEIYFSPTAKIGASAVIMGGGQDVPETAKLKIESYLRANIRAITEKYPYRSDVIRAMLDEDFELIIDEKLIKPEGELLTLTASEAMQEYGDPATPLLGKGIHKSIDELLDARFGAGNYEIKDFKVTYSEHIAKWMSTFAPALLGIGMLMLFFEFKTPGFGIFGIGGIVLIGVFFISQNIAGLAGNEVILFFALGIALVLVEIFLLPGVLVFGISGLVLMLGSLLFAMVDFWPEGSGVDLNLDMFVDPIYNLALGLTIALVGLFVFSRFLKGSWFESKLAHAGSITGHANEPLVADKLGSKDLVGAIGKVVYPLHPVGRVEIDGQRYEAKSLVGSIDAGLDVKVVQVQDFALVVEGVES